jgi:AraC family transcriptional regulator
MASPVVRDSTLRTHYESVARVISAMRNQIDRPMTLEQMARIGFASPSHFNRTFRQITGVPPLQFLYALRLEAAKRLLTETQKKVIDICYEVGYNSVGSFTRRFADVLGVSPTHLRKLASNRGRASRKLKRNRYGSVRPQEGVRLSGRIIAPESFHGLVAVGLFATPIPQSNPITCALVRGGGVYSLEGVPEGQFYLFAVGLERPTNGAVCFDYAAAMRAGGQAIRVRDNSVHGDTALLLRPPSPFDPPVLLVVPQQKLTVM